jgi:hypothetical protein
MNFTYEVLSNPDLSLDFIEEHLDKFTKAEFNILCIFNKHITKEFVELYPLHPWSYYENEKRLLDLEAIFPVDHDAIKKENKKKLRDKFDKFETKVSSDSKHKHLKK